MAKRDALIRMLVKIPFSVTTLSDSTALIENASTPWSAETCRRFGLSAALSLSPGARDYLLDMLHL